MYTFYLILICRRANSCIRSKYSKKIVHLHFLFARMAELVDALHSGCSNQWLCKFKSCFGYGYGFYRYFFAIEAMSFTASMAVLMSSSVLKTPILSRTVP